ncbi:Actin-interacting protein 1 [Zancudomyces culisetae]|uniref:Actin-interacting protein 1 n=1 Tax=Zancudomyces culisetae TaxID=1213189 RepID=A0A1R1PSC5_ZANCU|nr:Actin-interacting protein 1 [Zancudomyces culisetae]|eukprot:OMH83880.1 Actin-interacting protein 1 [Zancudomyces culisetae]
MVVERGAGREIGVYTASYDGKIYHRDIGRDNEVEEISRGDQKDSSSQINCMAIIAGSQSGEKQQSGGLALGAQDDSVYIVRGDKISKIHMEAPAVRLACKGPDTLVGMLTNGTVVDIDVRTETVKVSEGTEGAEATSVAATVRSTDAMVAVAVGYRNGTVRIIKDGAVVELQAVHTREVTQVAFSRCGKLIASGDAAGRINVSDAQTGAPVVAGRWSSHTAAIRALAWASDGQTLVSGALDSHVYVWRVDRAFGAVASELQMHPGGVVGIECIDDRIDGDEKMMIVSAGSDSIVTKSFI